MREGGRKDEGRKEEGGRGRTAIPSETGEKPHIYSIECAASRGSLCFRKYSIESRLLRSLTCSLSLLCFAIEPFLRDLIPRIL